MKKYSIIFLLLLLSTFVSIKSHTIHAPIEPGEELVVKKELSESQQLYQEINLEGKLNFEAFDAAYYGYTQLKENFAKPDIITVIDFTLPSSQKRMCVIDLKNKVLLYHTVVAHGKNSGQLYATEFSNRVNSNQSSLGFFVTENTYHGKNGYSLVIDGLEYGINDKAKQRYVVIHGANYCNESVIKATGRLGRSQGCPALPHSVNKEIINTIKQGTMLFIYAEDKNYLATSKLVNTANRTIIAQHEEQPAQNRATHGVLN